MVEHLRIAAISDTHGHTRDINIPACGLLLHAGDVGPDSVGREWVRHRPERLISWYRDVWAPWITPMLNDRWVKHVVLTWGNHDWTQLYTPAISEVMPPQVHILVDREITVEGLRIWGSPWSNLFNDWAWMDTPHALAQKYAQIPTGIDILLTHQPPVGEAGRLPFDELGSDALRTEMRRINPRAVVCGHIHAAAGVYDYAGIPVINAAVVNEAYRVVRGAVEVNLLKKVGPACVS